MENKVLVSDVGDGMIEVRLNRAEKRNAIDFGVMEELEAFLDQYEQDDQVRGLILTGSGDAAFCSGGDLSAFHSLKTEEESFRMLHRMGKILYRFAMFPAPVCALINGTAVGGGCELAMAADIRYAKKGIRMGFIQGTLSITTGWGGGSLLMERVDSSKAIGLLCSANIYGAHELLQKGVLDEILPEPIFQEEGVQYIKTMLAKNPAVTRAYKTIQVRKLKSSQLWERMEEEIRQCARLWGKEEHHHAVDLFFKRK
ncbi:MULTISPECIES: enoyl-CoA hydratase/isomerase family protein [Bacillaceae]|uniref:Enoyl-CoA hydratase/isomerase family protein n=1 Tax=Metabacillus sediminis TaxID=3117746 RepID=A0ABZ2NNA0_9BACI|nr:enoyl-CoA hydratase/isomerase family protein [Bacillus sp. SJS]KZZ82961.1 hypothetical protein AS29_019400 [Bacillus sp. SJS]